MNKRALFALGQVVSTQNALAYATEHQIDLLALLQRHHCGDWGVLCDEDRECNEQALVSHARILSNYPIGPDRIWIMTEADRSVTTILLPNDY